MELIDFELETISSTEPLDEIVQQRCLVIPINNKSSDIHRYYFMLLFVDKDGILSTTFAASKLRNCCVVYYSTAAAVAGTARVVLTIDRL